MAERSPRTYRLADLGCKVNQYETQLIAEHLERAGLRPAADGEPADLCVVNGCAVTAAAAAKSARAVRRLRRENPEATVAAVGCLVSALGKEETARRTGADLVIEQGEKPRLPGLPAPEEAPEHITRFDGHCRAFIKVQDGCDSFCAYCIVPRLRGAPRSRPLESIRAEARALEGSGHRELVLSGVHLGIYGRDLGGKPSLAEAVKAVLAAAPGARVRISSLDPSELTDDLLDLMAAEERIAPHLHLPLQSGDDGVLAAMRRRYTAGRFLEAVERARARLKRPGITSDVMAGFPGETEGAFQNTVEACRRAGLSRMHVFPFSPREGTDAAAMPGQVPGEVRRRRAASLIELGRELGARFASRCLGTVEQVLAEEVLADGRVAGYSGRYLRTCFTLPEGQAPRLRQIYRVETAKARGADLSGTARR